ncbi:MAG TPA: hypothetical protein VL096_14140, partial [Pirellulaceae bacterium]|nr:hypothetical protein [Pirellulaceae bacterium]
MPACLVTLLLLALAGCGRANSPPTVITAPAVVNEEWFIISSRPDLLAEAERLSKSNDQAAITQLFQELPQIGGYTELSTDRLLERHG